MRLLLFACWTLVAIADLLSTPLTAWPMLFAHDAASGYLLDTLNPVYAWTRTQRASPTAFTDQLNCGARAFDFRPAMDAQGKLVFHHGDVFIEQPVADSLHEITTWANQHNDPQDLVVLYAWDCTGTGCDGNLTQALTNANLTTVSDCGTVAKLTLGSAAELGKLAGGGHVLVLRDCVDDNYVPSNACSGFGNTANGIEEEDKYWESLCGPRPWNRESLVKCGNRILSASNGSSISLDSDDNTALLLSGNAAGGLAYQCWVGSASRDYPVTRIVNYLKTVASKKPSGRLQEMQCVWQESVASIEIGIMHLSSLLQDESKSQLNSLAVELISNGTLPSINLFEVNNVCHGGPDLLRALRAHAARQADLGEPLLV